MTYLSRSAFKSCPDPWKLLVRAAYSVTLFARLLEAYDSSFRREQSLEDHHLTNVQSAQTPIHLFVYNLTFISFHVSASLFSASCVLVSDQVVLTHRLRRELSRPHGVASDSESVNYGLASNSNKS
jgi:hypothetical protein